MIDYKITNQSDKSHEQYLQRAELETAENATKKQALVEHPFGTIKRQWGFDHIITKKGTERASADFGLIALAYNLRRLFNLGITAFPTLNSTVIFNLKMTQILPKQLLSVCKPNLHPILNFEYDYMQSAA